MSDISGASPLRSRQLDVLARPGSTPALLVVDVQRSFADPAYLSLLPDPGALTAVAAAIARIEVLIDAARSHDVPVVWVQLMQDAARPWRASNWLRTGRLDGFDERSEPCVIGTEGAQWYGVTPREGELRITKRAYSGFLGTELADRLRELEVDWAAIVGVTTECCVDATACDAFQLGWPVYVPEDACAAYDRSSHEHALAQLATTSALVGDTDELVGLFAATTVGVPL